MPQIIANSAAIATGHPLGALAGIEILREGGNAVDAAVAAMLALSVAIPGSVGLGGYGGSAVIYFAGSREPGALSRQPTAATRHSAKPAAVCPRQPRIVAIDFDSRAPLNFRNGLVTADPQSSYYGPRSVTVPAVIAGLELILREFGIKSWGQVSQPAIRLAEEGFDVDAEHKRHLDRCAPKFDRQSLESLFPAGATPRIGDHWIQPELAWLLRRLADDGPTSFYEGEIAQSIVRYLHDRGGILTDEDFRSYRPQIVDPICINFREFELYTPPPPSGGMTSLGIVQTVERFDPRRMAPWGAPYFHVLAEATKSCWQERHQYLGDPEFVSIPIDKLVSAQTADQRAEQIRQPGWNLAPRSPLPAPRLDSPHTANVIATDTDGNLVSLTATQGWMYGSHLVVDGLGLVLNHGMSRFDYRSAHPNAPAAGKRMQHNMSPMIALRDGRPAFAIGMPGGPKIVSVTAQLALDLMAFGATPAAAIAAPRLHTEGDESLLVSMNILTTVVAELEKFGHVVRREEDMGGPVNVLAVDPDTGKIDIASGNGTGAVDGY